MLKNNKKIKTLLLTGALVISGIMGVTESNKDYQYNSSAGTSVVQTIQYGTVTAKSLNMRSSASTKGKVIATLKKNTKVTIVKKQNSSWYQVKYGSKTGYVSAKYLKVTTSTTTSNNSTSSNTQYGTVTVSKLNMRSSASTKGKVIATLKKNTKVTIIKKQNSSWYQVKYGTKTGYVSAKYLKVTTTTTTSNNNSSNSSTNNNNSSTVKGMDFLEFQKKRGSFGFGDTGSYYEDSLISGKGRADEKGAYFGIIYKTPNFMATLKNCFNLLLPTKGTELYNIVSSKKVKDQTLYMDGRKVVIDVMDGGEFIEVDILKK